MIASKSYKSKIIVLLNEIFKPALDALHAFESNKYMFSEDSLILSPSDVGFHNMLQSSLIYYFIDFEYAGLDHPAKLFCDFILQPDSAFSVKEVRLMLDCIENMSGHIKLINTDHLIAMLPVYRFKWAIIIVNRIIRQGGWQDQDIKYFYNFFETSQNIVTNL